MGVRSLDHVYAHLLEGYRPGFGEVVHEVLCKRRARHAVIKLAVRNLYHVPALAVVQELHPEAPFLIELRLPQEIYRSRPFGNIVRRAWRYPVRLSG